jgi:hypothetical protein
MEIPIIPSEQVKRESGKTVPIPIIPVTGVTEFIVRAKKIPTGVKPVIPTGDTCCTKVCTIINNRVKRMEDDLRLREDELSSIKEGLLLETIKITVPKKGELKKGETKKPGKIETEQIEKERRVSVAYSQSRLKLKKQVHALTNQLSALKDIRYEMVEKGSCKCIEEVKFPEKEMMLEKSISEKEITKIK